mmetsp:Transcript_115479/g.333536  ORF Transcript_115479/g.333536 Transcript_115479/m.333536 type:complete len:310 (-) Transcript_115479:67-996(-)
MAAVHGRHHDAAMWRPPPCCLATAEGARPLEASLVAGRRAPRTPKPLRQHMRKHLSISLNANRKLPREPRCEGVVRARRHVDLEVQDREGPTRRCGVLHGGLHAEHTGAVLGVDLAMAAPSHGLLLLAGGRCGSLHPRKAHDANEASRLVAGPTKSVGRGLRCLADKLLPEEVDMRPEVLLRHLIPPCQQRLRRLDNPVILAQRCAPGLRHALRLRQLLAEGGPRLVVGACHETEPVEIHDVGQVLRAVACERVEELRARPNRLLNRSRMRSDRGQHSDETASCGAGRCADDPDAHRRSGWQTTTVLPL